MLVRDNDRAVMETLARSTVSMTEAEVFQLELKRSGVTTEADYVRVITQKTASFISACCRIGGVLRGVPARHLPAPPPGRLGIRVPVHTRVDALDILPNPEPLCKSTGAGLPQ